MEDQPVASTSQPPLPPKHAGPPIPVPPGMSKNAAKKLARRQKLQETKHERRAAERLKKKENKRARFLASTALPTNSEETVNKRRASSDSQSGAASAAEGSKRRKPDAAGSKQKEYFDARLVIDCGFDELMVDKESSSMTQQLMYLYSANRNAKMPFGELILTGQERPADCLKDVDPEQLSLVPPSSSSQAANMGGSEVSTDAGSIENNRIGQAMDGKLRGVWRRWKRVTIFKHGGLESLLSTETSSSSSSSSLASAAAAAAPSPSAPSSSSTLVAADSAPAETSTNGRHFASEETRQTLHRIARSDAIYLTADTDDTLETLEAGKTYIIGGIVDKNRYKGLCRAKADRLGIRAAKLPLSHDMLQAVERNVRLQGESIQDEAAVDGDHDEPHDQGGKGFVGRKVLTVNQVVEILTAWTETRDWVKALEKALPRRKLKQRGPIAKGVTGQVSDTTSRALEQEQPIEEQEEEEEAARNGS